MRSMLQRVLHDEGGFLQFLPALFGAGKTIYDIAKGKDKGPDLPAGPEYYEDPDYRKTQDYLRDLGIDILEGDIPEYYAGIGEPGGAEFENYLSLMTGDIERAGLDAAAAIGRGGGAVESTITQNVGEFTTKARYADFLRAMGGKEFLFGQGRGITEGVRSAGQVEGVKRNVFNLGRYQTDIDKILAEYGIDQKSETDYGELLGGDIMSMLGAFGGGKSTGTLEGGIGGYMGEYDWKDIFKDSKKPDEEDILSGVTGKERKTRLGEISSATIPNLDELFRRTRKGRS